MMIAPIAQTLLASPSFPVSASRLIFGSTNWICSGGNHPSVPAITQVFSKGVQPYIDVHLPSGALYKVGLRGSLSSVKNAKPKSPTMACGYDIQCSCSGLSKKTFAGLKSQWTIFLQPFLASEYGSAPLLKSKPASVKSWNHFHNAGSGIFWVFL